MAQVCETGNRFAKSRRNLQVDLQVLSKSTTFEHFKNELTRLESRSGPTLKLLAVLQDHPWTSEWVNEAAKRLTRLSMSKQHRRVIFIANAMRAWSWTQDLDARKSLLSGSKGRNPVVEMIVGPLSRMSLDLWLDTEDHIGLIPDWLINHRSHLLAGTGGWVTMLARLAGTTGGETAGAT